MASRGELVIHIIVGIERHLAKLKALLIEPADGYPTMKNDPELMID